MEQTQNRLTSAKWSRNLNEDVQSEANRLRLLERQRQILETKLQRRQNPTATSGVVASRPATSVSGSRTRIPQQITSDLLIDSVDQIVLDRPIKVNETSNGTNSTIVQQARARTSIPGSRRLASLDSPSSPTSVSSNSSVMSHHQVISQRPPTGSTPLSINMNKSMTNLRDIKSLSRSEASLKMDKGTSLIELNPLMTILSDEELVKFVSQPVPREVTMQCTIIRDKKGLDRSFYPTYYMHLQEIISSSPGDEREEKSKAGNELQGTATISMSDSVDSLESINSSDENETADKKYSSSIANQNEHNLSIKNSVNRKVFVLSGRRRKKSKTYLIGNNAFDISRDRCIAKLKSNVLGTQFIAIRLNSNGVRYEISSITYETNVLGFKGPRKMNIIIPKPDEKTNVLCNLSLQEEFKRNSRAILMLKNKTPIWNEETQSYVLNFHGRVTQASVKNFQLVTVDLARKTNAQPSSDRSINKLRKSASSHQLRQRYGDANARLDSQMNDIEINDDDYEDDELADTDDDINSQPVSKENSSKNKKNQPPPTRPMSKTLSRSGYLSTSTDDTKNMAGDVNDFVSLQFGRVSNTQFSCDVSWPFSLLQAFAIALSSFDSKLACE